MVIDIKEAKRQKKQGLEYPDCVDGSYIAFVNRTNGDIMGVAKSRGGSINLAESVLSYHEILHCSKAVYVDYMAFIADSGFPTPTEDWSVRPKYVLVGGAICLECEDISYGEKWIGNGNDFARIMRGLEQANNREFAEGSAEEIIRRAFRKAREEREKKVGN